MNFVPWIGFDSLARRCASKWKTEMQQLHPQMVESIEFGFAEVYFDSSRSIIDLEKDMEHNAVTTL